MAIDLLLTTAKKYYEDKAFVGKQIDEFLFPTLDNSLNTTVKIDDYTGSPFALRAITKGGQAKVREYQPGDGYEWEPPLFKEKTPIDEKLRDSVVAGVEAGDPQMSHLTQAVHHIIDGPKGFVPAAKMARAKAALDLYLTGKFTAYDEDETVKEMDFGRAGALALTANFGSVTQDAALKAMYDSLVAYGTPRGNLAVIMGSTWFADWEADAGVVAKRNATQIGAYLNKNNDPNGYYMGVEGLYEYGSYSIDGVAPMVKILVYEPNWQYLGASGGSSAAFMTATKAMMFPMGDMGWRFNRGIAVMNGSNDIQTVAEDLVFDSFFDSDPPTEWIRANARFMYAPGNVNHVAVSTGSGF